VKRFLWSKKLNSLSDSMTPGIWLSSLDYDEKAGEKISAGGAKQQIAKSKPASSGPAAEKITNKCLVLSGYASSMGEQGTASIGKFIKSLKENPEFYSDFDDIELGSIKAEKIQDQETMSFKLTCMFKQSER
jgi:hypothetical protein